MNTPVNFELAKLLTEKGYNKRSEPYRYNNNGELSLLEGLNAPTIAEVVMWLYEKHSLWLLALQTVTGHFAYKIVDVHLNPETPIERPPYKNVDGADYNTPTEAYEAAIEFVLTTKITQE